MQLHEIIESVENLSGVDVRIEVNCMPQLGYYNLDLRTEVGNPILFSVSDDCQYGGRQDIKIVIHTVEGGPLQEITIKFTRTVYWHPQGKMDSDGRLNFWLVDHEFTVKAGEKFSPEREPKISVRRVDWQLNPELMEFPAMGCGPGVKEIANE